MLKYYAILWRCMTLAAIIQNLTLQRPRRRVFFTCTLRHERSTQPDRQWRSSSFQESQKSARIMWPLTLSTPWMHADLESIACKFGGDPANCLREEAICAKVYRQTVRWRTSRHCISSFLEWANNQRFLCMHLLWLQGRSDGGYIGIYTHPKSAQVNFLWGKNDVRTAINSFIPPKTFIPPKQISGYAPGWLGGVLVRTLDLDP